MKTLLRRVMESERGVGMVMVVAFMGLCVPVLTTGLALAGALSNDSAVKTKLAKSQYSSIGALEYIRYLSDDPEVWDEWLDAHPNGETITLDDHELHVDANVSGYADYGFLDYCIFGTSWVKIKENTTVNCGVGSNGNVDVEEDSTIGGNIISGGNVVLMENVLVNGSVTAAGTVTLSEGASVSGTITEGATVETIAGPTPNYGVTVTITDLDTGEESQEYTTVQGSQYDLTFNLEAGGDNITVNSGETYTLAPGSYGTVEVKENATLNLSTGSYAFDEIRIKEGVTINLTVSSDDDRIVFDAVNVLEFKENVSMYVQGGDAENVIIRVANQAHFKEQGIYEGTYFGFEAAYAEMHVKENSTLTGALYGDTVEVKENAVVTGMPAIEGYLAFFGNN